MIVSEGHPWNCLTKVGHKMNCSENNVCNDVSVFVYWECLRKNMML